MAKSTPRHKAWKEFSRMIRLRDCLYTTGSIEQGRCVTCNNTYERQQLQAGHYVPGRTSGILFDERGVHAQCAKCNYQGGAWPDYDDWMEDNYGPEVCDRLKLNRHVSIKRTAANYDELRKEYKERADYMEQEGRIDDTSIMALPEYAAIAGVLE